MSEMDAAQPEAVRVGPEIESERGWCYTVSIQRGGLAPTAHEVTLSHHDYEHWCGGVEPPSRIAERAVRIAAASVAELPARFDLSQMRRRIDGFDARMASDE